MASHASVDDRNRRRCLEWVQYCPLVLEVDLAAVDTVAVAEDTVRRGKGRNGGAASRKSGQVPDTSLCDFIV